MTANELRIGNFVKLNNSKYHPENTGKIFMVDSIKCDDVSLFDYENLPSYLIYQYLKYIEPIELTEEWLLKFGIKDVWIKDSWRIFEDKDNTQHYGWSMVVRNASQTNMIEFAYFKYVHQLQNLYFDIVEEELKIK